MGRNLGLACAVLVVLIPASAWADRLVFRTGEAVELEAEEHADGTLTLRVEQGGAYLFPRDAFSRIEPGAWPPRDWPALRDAAQRGDSAARVAVLAWALENGLVREAVAWLEEMAPTEGHPAIARMAKILGRLAAPAATPDLTSLKRSLKGEFREHRAEHILLLHQMDPAEAALHAQRLEDVVVAFHLHWAARGLDDLRPPRERLVIVWFAEQSAYRAWLRSEGAGAFLDTRGYYHPSRRIVALYEGRSEPDQRRAAAQIEAERARAGQARGGDLNRRALLLELQRTARERGAAVHEMTHLLVIDSGLAPRYEAFPRWLHEGLALQFENIVGGRWAGIGRPNSSRAAAWAGASARPGLRAFLAPGGFERIRQDIAYAGAWALVGSLERDEPARFVAFLDLLRRPGGVTDAAGAFAAAFGDLPGRELAWRRFPGGPAVEGPRADR